MMIVVDANIIFSAAIKPLEVIGTIIFSENDTVFIAPDYLKNEIDDHKEKLTIITKKSEQEIEFVLHAIYRKITFYSAAIIPNSFIETAKDIVSDIDPDDFIYVAFALFFKAKLWSGDKVLAKGLQEKGLDMIATTFDVTIAIQK